jgi:hypothetical protein
MNDRRSSLGVTIVMIALMLIIMIGTTIMPQRALSMTKQITDQRSTKGAAAPIATSGNNVYVTWWTNKTGNDEVMFKASNDAGKTFGSKINLSNSPGIRSDNAEIAASGNNVYVSWWERANQTSNEPVMKVSNDNGKTFGEKIMLSDNATTAKPML